MRARDAGRYAGDGVQTKLNLEVSGRAKINYAEESHVQSRQILYARCMRFKFYYVSAGEKVCEWRDAREQEGDYECKFD